MAEVINKILESLLPNLEDLLQSGIFNETEIRLIVQKRRRHEHRLFSKPPQLHDFLEAIKYEMDLDRLRKCRKESLGIASLNTDGEFGIVNRIHGMFRRALKNFKGDLRLWYQYIKFCEQCNQENELRRVYGKALAVHPNEIALWIMAAKFEFDTRKDTESARTIFQQSIKANTNNEHLWIEYFRMELLFVDKLLKRRETLGLDPEEDEKLTDQLLSCKLPQIVYNHAIRAIPDCVEFRLKFIEISLLFNGTDHLEDTIYESLQKDFSNRALCWDCLAKRCWRAKPHDYSVKTKEMYMEGMKHVKGEDEMKLLWKLYCEWSLNHTHIEKKMLRELMSLSLKKQLITEELCVLLFNRMLQYGQVDLVLLLMDSVLDRIPHSIELWKIKLQLKEPSVTMEMYCLLCREAVKAMDTLELKLLVYQLWIDTMLLKQQDINIVLQEALNDIRHETIMERVLEWSYINSGSIKDVRKSFKSITARFSPLPCSIYLKYINMEYLEGTPPKRSIVNEGLYHHGDHNADIWLLCIRAELRRGKFDSIQTLHWRATHTITDKHVLDEFNQHYNNIISCN